jgi:hypothetical protein
LAWRSQPRRTSSCAGCTRRRRSGSRSGSESHAPDFGSPQVPLPRRPCAGGEGGRSDRREENNRRRAPRTARLANPPVPIASACVVRSASSSSRGAYAARVRAYLPRRGLRGTSRRRRAYRWGRRLAARRRPGASGSSTNSSPTSSRLSFRRRPARRSPRAARVRRSG